MYVFDIENCSISIHSSLKVLYFETSFVRSQALIGFRTQISFQTGGLGTNLVISSIAEPPNLS